MMAITGVYNGSSIETAHQFPVNQRVIIIPIDDTPRINEKKKAIIEKLFGCLDGNVTLEDMRDERLSRYETAH